MPVQSRFSTPIPNASLPTWLFKSPTGHLPDKPPIYYSAEDPAHNNLSLSDYRLWSQRLARGLRDHGVQRGDRVMLFSSNNLFFPVVIMGVVMSGAIFTGANPAFSPRELIHQLKDADCSLLLTSAPGLTTALAAARACKLSYDRVFLFDSAGVLDGNEPVKSQGIDHWTRLLANPQSASLFAWEDFQTEEQCHETAALNYSSGTTGLSKGVEISHRNFVSNACQLINLEEQDPNEGRKRADIRWLACLPMYHAMGQCIFVTMAPARGIPSYIMRQFDFLEFLRCIERFRITELMLVPPIIVQLAKRPEVRKFNLGSVNTIASGAAPLAREVCAEVEAMWPPGVIAIKQGWGMTECTCGILGFHPLEKPIPLSVGELTANCEAKVMKDDGVSECSRNERGEIWVRAPNITKGYWRKREETEKTIAEDHWLKTGDIGFVDSNAKWFIVDRIKELIKVKGHQVAPAEIEGLLLEHPGVIDAAVIGVTLNGEERPRAYVVRAHSQKPSLSDVLSATNTKLAQYKRVTGGIVDVIAIPKNPSGKILRKELREQAKRELENPRARL